jgi:hypothetical protein
MIFLEPDNPIVDDLQGNQGSPCDPLPFKGGILPEGRTMGSLN